MFNMLAIININMDLSTYARITLDSIKFMLKVALNQLVEAIQLHMFPAL